ncbi:glycogen synthase GlgA [Prosthecomicrobium sp. N25]|uniref:glycogen synthase GlgA n=1 Tax=Prosthecomicrobium sp. N25 TaxID=3129254 RepID=UPI003076D414
MVKVLSVASEIYPLVKTGGLADVAGALPLALAAEGVAVTSLVPGYPAVTAALEGGRAVLTLPDLFGGPARLVAGTAAGLDLLVLDAPHLYDRPGNPYVGADGRDWPDNAVRFAALSRAAALVGLGEAEGARPDVVHAHDWQAGLAAAYLAYDGRPRPGTVITVHNLAFQGQYPRTLMEPLGLPERAWSVDGVEYYGHIGYLKAGLQLSDRITTVSPSYAAEIRTAEGGMGLDGLLRARTEVLHGILNGIDDRVWDPATDPLIPATYDARRPARRRLDKAALQERFGLAKDPDAILFGVISRLTWQKGLDILLASAGTLLQAGGQLVVLGTGEPALEQGFAALADAHPDRIGCRIGYDEALAHLIQAGSDALVVPSRFEPCGLTQLCALRYGAVPVVARVGGLADTIVDANEMARAAGAGTGFQFSPVNPDMLSAAILRAAAVHRDREAWQALVKNGMKTDVSWRRPAAHYARLYRDLVAARS